MKVREKAKAKEWMKGVPEGVLRVLHDHCLEEATKVLVNVARTMADDPRMAERNGREALLILADAMDPQTPPTTETH